jgi:hypothetical protein
MGAKGYKALLEEREGLVEHFKSKLEQVTHTHTHKRG